MGKRENLKDLDNHPVRFLSMFIVLMGILTLLLAIFSHTTFLRFLSRDGHFQELTLKRIGHARMGLLIEGILFVLIGLLSHQFKWPEMLIGRTRRINISLLVIGFIWILILAETLFRIIPLQSPSVRRDLRLSMSPAYEPSSFSVHKLSSFNHDIYDKGGLRAILRNGYRGREFPLEKPDGEIRVVFLGGSFVYDDQAVGKDWPHQVEELMRKKGYKNIRVINGGVPGHSTSDCIGRIYSEIHFFRPDFIILCNAWNDIKYFRDISPANSLLQIMRPLGVPSHKDYRKKPTFIMELLETSQLYLRLSALFKGSKENNMWVPEGRLPGGEIGSSYSEHGVRQYKLNLQIFIDICQNIPAEPILFTQPRLPAQSNSDEDKARIGYGMPRLTHDGLLQAFNDCDSTIYLVAKEKNVKFFDLAKLYTGKSELFNDHIHLTSLGVEKVAKAVADYLIRIIDVGAG